MCSTLEHPITHTRTRPRFAAWIAARLRVAGSLHGGTVVSLSSGGLFVATTATIPCGTSVGVDMTLPDVGRLAVQGTAIYAATHQGLRGFGIRLEPGEDVTPAVESLRAWHEDYTWFPPAVDGVRR